MSDTEADEGQLVEEEEPTDEGQPTGDDQSNEMDPKVEIVLKQEMGDITPQVMGESLELSTLLNGEDTKQFILQVKVTSTAQSHVGHRVGLVQNLMFSERVATYGFPDQDPAGTLTTLPSSGSLPVLDAKEGESKPFYDDEAGGQELPGIEESITFILKDMPGYNAPFLAVRGDEKIPLLSSKVEEKFIICLYDENSKKTIKQWSWEYSYAYDHVVQDALTGRGTGTVTNPQCKIEDMECGIPLLDGDTAGNENTVHEWSNNLSAEYY